MSPAGHGMKLPMDAYVLAVPLTAACMALGAMVFNTLRNDPDQSKMSFYENPEQEQAAENAANAYHLNPAKRYFDTRVTGQQTWGVFNNDFSKH